ncbi:MAG: hypothetical protein ACK5Z5_05980 [Neisseriaceae bacterium]
MKGGNLPISSTRGMASTPIRQRDAKPTIKPPVELTEFSSYISSSTTTTTTKPTQNEDVHTFDDATSKIMTLPDFNNTILERKQFLCRDDLIHNIDIMQLYSSGEVEKRNQNYRISSFLDKFAEVIITDKRKNFILLVDILTNIFNVTRHKEPIVTYYGIKLYLSQILGRINDDDDVNLVLGMCIHPSIGTLFNTEYRKYTDHIKSIFQKLAIKINDPADLEQTILNNYNIFNLLACRNVIDAKKIFNLDNIQDNKDNVLISVYPTNSTSSLTGLRGMHQLLNRNIILANEHVIEDIKKYKEKFILKFDKLYEYQKESFIILIDILTNTFCSNSAPSFSIKYEWIRRYINKMLNYNVEVIDDDVNFLIIMCTSKFPYPLTSLILYTDLTKEVCSNLHIMLSFQPKSILELKKLVENDILNISSFNTIKMKHEDISIKETKIFNLVKLNKYSMAFACINEIVNNESIGPEDKVWFRNISDFIELFIFCKASRNLKYHLFDIKCIIDNFGNDQFHKERFLYLIFNHFPEIYFKFLVYPSIKFKGNDRLNNLIEETPLKLDLCGLNLSGWKIRIDNFDIINFMDYKVVEDKKGVREIEFSNPCTVDYNTKIEVVNGPVLIGPTNDRIRQLHTWYLSMKKIISIPKTSLSAILMNNLQSLTKKCLFEILEIAKSVDKFNKSEYFTDNFIRIQKEIGVSITTREQIEKIDEISVEQIIGISNIDSTQEDLSHILKEHRYFFELVESRYKLTRETRPPQYIAEIIIKQEYNLIDNKFLVYCQAHYPSQYFAALLSLSIEKRILIKETFNEVRFFTDMNFEGKDLRNLCLIDVLLEEIISLKGCIANNNTSINLVNPFLKNVKIVPIEELIVNWLNKCIKILRTADDPTLSEILIKEVGRLLENLYYTDRVIIDNPTQYIYDIDSLSKEQTVLITNTLSLMQTFEEIKFEDKDFNLSYLNIILYEESENAATSTSIDKKTASLKTTYTKTIQSKDNIQSWYIDCILQIKNIESIVIKQILIKELGYLLKSICKKGKAKFDQPSVQCLNDITNLSDVQKKLIICVINQIFKYERIELRAKDLNILCLYHVLFKDGEYSEGDYNTSYIKTANATEEAQSERIEDWLTNCILLIRNIGSENLREIILKELCNLLGCYCKQANIEILFPLEYLRDTVNLNDQQIILIKKILAQVYIFEKIVPEDKKLFFLCLNGVLFKDKQDLEYYKVEGGQSLNITFSKMAQSNENIESWLIDCMRLIENVESGTLKSLLMNNFSNLIVKMCDKQQIQLEWLVNQSISHIQEKKDRKYYKKQLKIASHHNIIHTIHIILGIITNYTIN